MVCDSNHATKPQQANGGGRDRAKTKNIIRLWTINRNLLLVCKLGAAVAIYRNTATIIGSNIIREKHALRSITYTCIKQPYLTCKSPYKDCQLCALQRKGGGMKLTLKNRHRRNGTWINEQVNCLFGGAAHWCIWKRTTQMSERLQKHEH